MTELSPAAQAVLDGLEDDCIHPDDKHRIAAAALLIPRGQLIRERALGKGPTPRPSRHTYARAVENAARVVSGVPRPHLEAIVASVVTTLAQSDAT